MSCAGSQAVGGDCNEALSEEVEAGEIARQEKGEDGLLYGLSFNAIQVRDSHVCYSHHTSTNLHIKLGLSCADTVFRQRRAQVVHRQRCTSLILGLILVSVYGAYFKHLSTLTEPRPVMGALALPLEAFVRIRAC